VIRFGVVPAAVLFALVFPVVLLSLLANNTPFSSEVWRGLQLAAKSWLVFCVEALALVGAGLGLAAMRIKSTSGVLNLVVCAGLVVACLCFFRVLGRLAWVSQEKLGEGGRKTG
jgi:hypothetical protein